MSNTMREILFRGKRVDNGEWINGSVLSFEDGKKVILRSTAKVFKEHGTTTVCCNECYDVYTETVGQFTGLTDKNGNKIFEGDIVYFTNGHRYVVMWEYGGLVLKPISSITLKTNFSVMGTCWIEGNIHDSPEWLEESNEKQM